MNRAFSKNLTDFGINSTKSIWEYSDIPSWIWLNSCSKTIQTEAVFLIELRLIVKIKDWEELVQICSGCTYIDSVSLKKMFSEKDYIGSKFWIERLIKTKE